MGRLQMSRWQLDTAAIHILGHSNRFHNLNVDLWCAKRRGNGGGRLSPARTPVASVPADVQPTDGAWISV